MNIFIICKTQVSTRTIINLYKTYPDIFKYTEGFETLDDSIIQYLNDLDVEDKGEKFKQYIPGEPWPGWWWFEVHKATVEELMEHFK